MDKNFKGTEEEYIEFRKKRNKSSMKYYFKNHKRLLEEHSKYRVENKKKISKYGKRLRATPEYKSRIKKWVEENKEHLREYRKTPEYKKKKALSDKKYYKENRKEINKAHRNWVIKNKETIKKYNQKYYTSPKGRINYTHHNHKRLAMIKDRPTDLTNEKIKRILWQNKECVYCGNNGKLELDHIIPLKNNGSCMENNIVVACEGCNRSKSRRDVFYWCNLRGIDIPKIVLKKLKSQSQGTKDIKF